MPKTTYTPRSPGNLVPIALRSYDRSSNPPALVEYQASAFVPDDLPPKLDWKDAAYDLSQLHQRALLALGELNGLHKRLGNASSMLRTLWMREAKLSSGVENIETTAEDMVLAGAGRTPGARATGQEAWNYVRALEHGIQSDLPLCGRLIREMHEHLLRGVRGEDLRPGEFRTIPVYIGDRELGPSHARYVPPPPGKTLEACMTAFERFVHSKHAGIPPLFAIAIAHYQFEAVHPFRDGNGRIGRVLISRSLCKAGLLRHPVVYMSAYIYRHKRTYVDALLRVSTHGAWTEWIEFLLTAILTQARDAVARSDRLITLRERYIGMIHERKAPSRTLALIDRLFEMPAINAAEAESILNVTRPVVYNDLALLENLGILSEYTGRKMNRDWLAREIMRVIEADRFEAEDQTPE